MVAELLFLCLGGAESADEAHAARVSASGGIVARVSLSVFLRATSRVAMLHMYARSSAAAGCAAGVICWRWRVFFVEGAKIEDFAEERPCKGEIGDEDSGARFADIPCDPGRLVGVGETVVFVQDGGEDDEEAEGEDAAENEFALEREQRADEHGQGYAEHEDVGGNVEDGVGYAVIGESGALRGVGWDGPVLTKGTTPCSKVQDFHDDESEGDIGG